MKQIPLSRGMFAVIDDEDYNFIIQFKWYAHNSRGTFYAARRDSNRRIVLMHRIISQAPDNMLTDHRDGDGLNNRRSNLRNATGSQNQMNRRAIKGASSRYKGVFHTGNNRKNCWRAHIRVGGQGIHLGVFRTEEEAHAAYVLRAKSEFGSFFCAGRES